MDVDEEEVVDEEEEQEEEEEEAREEMGTVLEEVGPPRSELVRQRR